MHGGLVASILLLNEMSYYHLSGAGATVHLQHPAEKRSTLGDCRFLLPKNPWASIGHISLSSFRPDSWLWLEWRQTDAGDTTQVSTFIYGQHIFPHKILTLSPSKITIPSAEFFTKDSFPLFSFRSTPPLFETRPGQNIAFNSGIWIVSGKTKFSFEYCSQKSSKKFVHCDDQFFSKPFVTLLRWPKEWLLDDGYKGSEIFSCSWSIVWSSALPFASIFFVVSKSQQWFEFLLHYLAIFWPWFHLTTSVNLVSSAEYIFDVPFCVLASLGFCWRPMLLIRPWRIFHHHRQEGTSSTTKFCCRMSSNYQKKMFRHLHL